MIQSMRGDADLFLRVRYLIGYHNIINIINITVVKKDIENGALEVSWGKSMM